MWKEKINNQQHKYCGVSYFEPSSITPLGESTLLSLHIIRWQPAGAAQTVWYCNTQNLLRTVDILDHAHH